MVHFCHQSTPSKKIYMWAGHILHSTLPLFQGYTPTIFLAPVSTKLTKGDIELPFIHPSFRLFFHPSGLNDLKLTWIIYPSVPESHSFSLVWQILCLVQPSLRHHLQDWYNSSCEYTGYFLFPFFDLKWNSSNLEIWKKGALSILGVISCSHWILVRW